MAIAKGDGCKLTAADVVPLVVVVVLVVLDILRRSSISDRHISSLCGSSSICIEESVYRRAHRLKVDVLTAPDVVTLVVVVRVMLHILDSRHPGNVSGSSSDYNIL